MARRTEPEVDPVWMYVGWRVAVYFGVMRLHGERSIEASAGNCGKLPFDGFKKRRKYGSYNIDDSR